MDKGHSADGNSCVCVRAQPTPTPLNDGY